MSTTPNHLFTFGVVYVVDGETYVEEIDVEASTEAEAKALAEEEARTELRPGWDRIVPLPPGGSGGLVIL